MRALRYLTAVVALLGALVTPVETQPDRVPTRRALIVGIDRYLPATVAHPSSREVPDLEGSVNDAEAMKAVLIARYGFQPENVRLLRNGEATRDRILSEARNWLVRPAATGDVSVFFYAGHGSQMYNSRSNELDKMDETIVPADAKLDKPDIRDKELARIFDEAIDKGVVLTAIFDSCHSGSIARGIGRRANARVVAPDRRDAADADNPVPPESRGALILSAAQDLQIANEMTVPEDRDAMHGIFTWALVRVLRTAPVNESVDRTFLRVRGLMQSDPIPQEPVLAGVDLRRRATIFGAPQPPSSAVVVAVQSVEADGSVILQGGLAAGIRLGAELKLADRENGPVLRVTASEGLAQSRAQIISGLRTSVRPGALFAMTKWAAPVGQLLRVWVPSADTSADLASALRARLDTADRVFEFAGTPADADYVLSRRVRNSVPEYAWTRPFTTEEAARQSPLPASTAWIPLTDNPGTLIGQLRDFAVRLGVIYNWLLLESPPDSGRFPYRLALKDATTLELRTGSFAKDGDTFGIVLALDPALKSKAIERRYVYVFSIDNTGESTLLFPRRTAGNVENLLPLRTDEFSPPEEIPLGTTQFAMGAGVDTFFLLTTSTALADSSVLAGNAVQPASRAMQDPLSRLLSHGRVLTRGAPVTTPADWSIDRFTIRTLAPGEKR
jgi:Caspase domain